MRSRLKPRRDEASRARARMREKVGDLCRCVGRHCPGTEPLEVSMGVAEVGCLRRHVCTK
jgi:hypothetical protein